MEIIPVGPHLIDEILSIQTECGLSEWTREGYLDELGRSDSVLIAARIGTTLVGFLAGRSPASTNSQPSHGDIYNIGTRAAFRQKGVGTALLNHFLRTCDERHVEKIWLDVRHSNDTAKTFYLRHGFVKTGARKAFYTNPTEDADVMCRKGNMAASGQSY